jgi:hypothetical protein
MLSKFTHNIIKSQAIPMVANDSPATPSGGFALSTFLASTDKVSLVFIITEWKR